MTLSQPNNPPEASFLNTFLYEGLGLQDMNLGRGRILGIVRTLQSIAEWDAFDLGMKSWTQPIYQTDQDQTAKTLITKLRHGVA